MHKLEIGMIIIKEDVNIQGNTASPAASTAMEVIITFNDDSQETWYVLNINPAPAYTMWAIGCGPVDLNSFVAQGIVFNNFGTQRTEDLIDCDVKSYAVRITDYEIVG